MGHRGGLPLLGLSLLVHPPPVWGNHSPPSATTSCANTPCRERTNGKWVEVPPPAPAALWKVECPGSARVLSLRSLPFPLQKSARCPSPTVCKDRTPRTQEGKEERVPPGGLALGGLERERGVPQGSGRKPRFSASYERKGEPPQWFEIKCPSGSAMEKVLPSGVPG